MTHHIDKLNHVISHSDAHRDEFHRNVERLEEVRAALAEEPTDELAAEHAELQRTIQRHRQVHREFIKATGAPVHPDLDGDHNAHVNILMAGE